MHFAMDDSFSTKARMKVIGLGGAGGNALNRMVQSGLEGVEFIAINTDAMALDNNLAHVRIQIGEKITGGLGAGANPQVGMEAMEEDRDKVRNNLEGADMVFITAGMGGGTGTGSAPVVAQIARELGILTVGVVTKPFLFEGPVREKNAMLGLEALRNVVDTIIVIPNQKLLSIIDRTTTFRDAFRIADEVLTSATRGISDIVLKHGDIQVDFADVKAVMSQGGDALMGSGRGKGENRAITAADGAIHSPLLDNISIAGASGVLVNITAGEDLGMLEVEDSMNYIYDAIGKESNSNIIWGTVINPEIKDEIRITVIATGFGDRVLRPAPAPKTARHNFFAASDRNHDRNDLLSKREFGSQFREVLQSKTPVKERETISLAGQAPSEIKSPFKFSPLGKPETELKSESVDTSLESKNSSSMGASEEQIVREDNLYYEAIEKTRKPGTTGGFNIGSDSRYQDSSQSEDVDYETPAFLRYTNN